MRAAFFRLGDLSRFWWGALLFMTAIRFVITTIVPLQGTEAYYWLWSEHPAAGYYDHPPLVAWSIALSTSIFGKSLWAIRLPSLLGITGVCLLVWWLARAIGGPEAGAMAGLSCLFLPYFTYLCSTAFPDGVKLFFCALCIVLLYRKWWFLSGLAAGLAFLCKIPALVLLAPVFWRVRSWSLVRWSFGLLLGASPFLWWSAHNGWVTFAFQFGSRHAQQSEMNLLGPLHFLGVQAAAVSPVLLFALLMVTVRCIRCPHQLSWFMIFPWVAFGLASFQHNIMPHWPLVAYIASLVLLGVEASNYPRLWFWSTLTSVAFTMLLVLVGLFPRLLFLTGGEALTEPYAIAGLAAQLPNDELVFAENHGLTSMISFHRKDKTHWYSRNLHGRQFLLWDDYVQFRGRDVLFVDIETLEERMDVKVMLDGAFEEVLETREVVGEWEGRAARIFYVTRCRGFRGAPPPGADFVLSRVQRDG